MAYTKTTDFASKDSLLTGDPAKVVKGSEIDAEFDNIETVIGTTTGSGAVVLATSPTLVTPVLGTPASGTVTNLTGTASININGTVGATTPASGAFTTLTTSSTITASGSVTGTRFIPSGSTVPTNGLYLPSANTIGWATNSTVRGVIDSSGNWGIGTSSPGEKLHIFGNAVDTAAKITKNGTDSALVGVDSEVYVGAGGALAFRTGGYTSAYDKAKLDASGNFLVGVSSATTNGGKIETSNGITFPATQSACSNANTLDDYEEGYHTPATVTCGTSGTVTLDSSYDTLSYTKIGRQITVSGNLAVASVSSPVGYFSISLPVAAASLNENSDRWPAVVVVTTTNAANAADFIGWASSSTLDVYLGDATAQQTDSANELKAGSNIWINVTYFTA